VSGVIVVWVVAGGLLLVIAVRLAVLLSRVLARPKKDDVGDSAFYRPRR